MNLFEMYTDENIVQSVADVLRRNTFWANGGEIGQFESKIASKTGRKYAVAFNSGTSALYAAMLAYLKPRSRVIVPSFTFIATANAVVAAGCVPVFADIEETTFGLDISSIEQLILGHTRAIAPIHFAGNVSIYIEDMKSLADQRHIILIEDACHSLGASAANIGEAGSFGHVGVFSFCQNKLIATGEGGMVVTDDQEIADKLRRIRSHGQDIHGEYVELGLNFRMPSFVAALGLAQLERINYLLTKRQGIFEHYHCLLEDIDNVDICVPPRGQMPVYQLLNIRFRNEKIRDFLMGYLRGCGIPSRIAYKPVHLTPYYRSNFVTYEGMLPVTERVSSTILNLPSHVNMTPDDVDEVVTAIKGGLAKC